ncbi:MAG: N-acetylglucosamine malate deacetylase 1 [Verrucomicrobiota bacterium]|jgi:LmbE family N-acetylglucosaminyl deacetylase
MNVLVIAPHPDDESIGCGGAVSLHVQRHDHVTAVFLTSGELGLKRLPREKAWEIRESEAQKAGKILGLAELFFLRCPDWFLGENKSQAAKLLRPILKQIIPATIFLPHPNEWHPDHQAAWPILKAALKGSGVKVSTLLGYEVWTPLSQYNDVEDISSVMSRKLRAVRAHRSQMTDFKYDRAIAGLNRYRGAMAAKTRYAEVFQTLTPGK